MRITIFNHFWFSNLITIILQELETQINSVGLFKSEQKMIQNSFEEKIKQLEIIDSQKQREVENLSMDLNQAKVISLIKFFIDVLLTLSQN